MGVQIDKKTILSNARSNLNERHKANQLSRMRLFVIPMLSLLLASQPVSSSLIGDQIFCSIQTTVGLTATGVENNLWDPAFHIGATNLQQPHPIVGAGVECDAVGVGSADFSEVDGMTLLTFSTRAPGSFVVRFSDLDLGPGEVLSEFKLVEQSSNVEHPLIPLIIDEENPHEFYSVSGIYIFSPSVLAVPDPCLEDDPDDCPPPLPPFVHTFSIHGVSVPEPGILALLGIGLVGMAISRRGRKSEPFQRLVETQNR